MRSSDLFTTIAEKSRPTATTHSEIENGTQRADETGRPESRSAPRPLPREVKPPRETAPRTSPPGRAMSLVSSLVGPLPACRSDYLYRLPVSERETARLRALPRSQLAPGTAYRDPTPRRDAIRRRIGFREFEGSRTCGSRRSRTRYTRHATHGHPPKSAIRSRVRSIVVLVVRGVRV